MARDSLTSFLSDPHSPLWYVGKNSFCPLKAFPGSSWKPPLLRVQQHRHFNYPPFSGFRPTQNPEYPLFKEGWPRPKKISRSLLSGADGVVVAHSRVSLGYEPP